MASHPDHYPLFWSNMPLDSARTQLIKNAPLQGQRLELRGHAILDNRFQRVQITKYREIFIEPGANIEFGRRFGMSDEYPLAVVILCEKLIFRPISPIPDLYFNVAHPPAPKRNPFPGPPVNSGGWGNDSPDGLDGWPYEETQCRIGAPIYILVDVVEMLSDPPPNVPLAQMFARGQPGQDGMDGTSGGDCWDGPCKNGAGKGGKGGDGGTGMGGGNFYLYGPESALSLLSSRTRFFYDGAPGGKPGKQGRPGIGKPKNPPTGGPGKAGRDGLPGDVNKVTYSGVKALLGL